MELIGQADIIHWADICLFYSHLRGVIKMELSHHSDERIHLLKQRQKRCVCRYCGDALVLKRLTYNAIDIARVEIFCNRCERIEFGVEPEIYRSAQYFVEELEFNPYPDFEKNAATKQMAVAKVAEIMSWSAKNLGFLGDEGFLFELKYNPNVLGESIIIDDSDLENKGDNEIFLEVDVEKLLSKKFS